MATIEIDKRDFRSLLESEATRISDYSVGLVQPMTTDGLPDAGLAGSGTLVTGDDVDGVLTASHVIELLRRARFVGFVLPSSGIELHNVSCRMDDCADVSFYPNGMAVDGPDLSLLVPPADLLGTLRAKKSFYNLSKRQSCMLEKPEPLEHGLWMLSGFAGEWVGDGEPVP